MVLQLLDGLCHYVKDIWSFWALLGSFAHHFVVREGPKMGNLNRVVTTTSCMLGVIFEFIVFNYTHYILLFLSRSHPCTYFLMDCGTFFFVNPYLNFNRCLMMSCISFPYFCIRIVEEYFIVLPPHNERIFTRHPLPLLLHSTCSWST